MQRWFGFVAVVLVLSCASREPAETIVTEPRFESVQPELFGAYGAQPNAWADYDNDGDLDLYVGFRYSPNRLYKNDDGIFRDVAAEVGLDVMDDTRVASWGDFDADGHLDLFIGWTSWTTPASLPGGTSMPTGIWICSSVRRRQDQSSLPQRGRWPSFYRCRGRSGCRGFRREPPGEFRRLRQ